uniref:Uncharacterized protein n=1 Tax=Bionectria ochroleuca TaxID=29856 RepID=A0A8H7TRC2_BIOOC
MSRYSKVSFDNRFSLSTVDDLDNGNTSSNRSSATIRPVSTINGPNGLVVENSRTGSSGGASATGTLSAEGTSSGNELLVPGGSMRDFDFDKALLKFAAEREDFLEDLTFSAGAKVQARPPMINPRAERIRADEAESGRMSPLKSIKGSIRRRISFRDMNSMRRQPSTARNSGASRAASVRTTKRMSNYNSVIPPRSL